MINEVMVHSRFHLEVDIGLYKPKHSIMKQFLPYDSWYLISIHTLVEDPLLTPRTEEALKALGCKGFLDLQFWDITDKEYKEEFEDCDDARLFNVEDAIKVIEFIDKVNEDESDNVLVAHCDAGVSRSGAVGRFATEYFGLDEERFYKVNDGIEPNIHVYSTLKNESGMNPYLENFDPKFGER